MNRSLQITKLWNGHNGQIHKQTHFGENRAMSIDFYREGVAYGNQMRAEDLC